MATMTLPKGFAEMIGRSLSEEEDREAIALLKDHEVLADMKEEWNDHADKQIAAHKKIEKDHEEFRNAFWGRIHKYLLGEELITQEDIDTNRGMEIKDGCVYLGPKKQPENKDEEKSKSKEVEV